MDTVKNRTCWIALIVAALVFGLGGRSADAVGISITARTAQEQAIADWALTRFEAAGLELPALEVVFHARPSGSHGNSGWYQGDRVDLCIADQSEAYARRTLVHELGHAWAAAALTDEERDRFMRARGLSTWNSRDASWAERAFEQAAEVISWGVGARETRILLPDHDDPESLGAAFELLTGKQPAE